MIVDLIPVAVVESVQVLKGSFFCMILAGLVHKMFQIESSRTLELEHLLIPTMVLWCCC